MAINSLPPLKRLPLPRYHLPLILPKEMTGQEEFVFMDRLATALKNNDPASIFNVFDPASIHTVCEVWLATSYDQIKEALLAPPTPRFDMGSWGVAIMHQWGSPWDEAPVALVPVMDSETKKPAR